jgi:hypothetical protein
MKSSLKAEYKEISFEDAWAKSPPSEVKGQSLPDFINEVRKTSSKRRYVNAHLSGR